MIAPLVAQPHPDAVLVHLQAEHGSNWLGRHAFARRRRVFPTLLGGHELRGPGSLRTSERHL